MRKLSVIALLLALAMIFAGCNLIQVNEERDMQRVVIKVGDETILKQEYVDAYNGIVYQYQVSEDDLKDADTASRVQEFAIEQVITEKIIDIKAREMGCYDFTQEELDEINATVDDTLVYYKNIAQNRVQGLEENKDKTEEELKDLVEKDYVALLESIKFDEQAYRDSVSKQKAGSKLYDKVTDIGALTESELQSEYDKKVVEQRTGEQEGTLDFERMYINGDTIYYNPAGMRKTRHILIALPDDVRSKISDLKRSENAEDTEEADKLLKEELSKIEEKANDVFKQIGEGKDFDELIAEFGEDPGMQEDNVYVIKEDTTSFAPEFVEGLFSLKNKGEYTKPVGTEFGYHIILYVDDIQEGEVPFEDVKETIENELTTAKKETMYSDQMATWKEEIKTKVYKSKLKYTID